VPVPVPVPDYSSWLTLSEGITNKLAQFEEVLSIANITLIKYGKILSRPKSL